MRAYHRVDPLMDERKSHYTPAQFGAFQKVQLVAGRQMQRGWFRSMAALKGCLPAAYAKHVQFLVDERDLVVHRDGRVYVDGWDEWQEGDFTVAERMARLRNKQRIATVTRTSPEPSPTAIGVGVSVGVGISGANAPLGARDQPPSGDRWPRPQNAETYHLLEELTGRTAGQAGERQLSEFDRQFTDHPPAKVEAAYRKAAKAFPSVPTARQLVWAARNILEPFAKPDDIRKLEERERSDAEREASQRRVEATRRRAEELRRASGE